MLYVWAVPRGQQHSRDQRDAQISAAHVDAICNLLMNHDPDAMPPPAPANNDELGPQRCEQVSQLM